MTTHTMRRPDDFHVHLREGAMLDKVVGYTSQSFGRALVMPNTTKPILTGEDAVAYKKDILRIRGEEFQPLMTIKLVRSTTPTIIREAKAAGVVAAKFYPEGVTTNSEDGMPNLADSHPVLQEMERQGMVLCLHGETPGVFCMDRETVFLSDLSAIANTFPKLKIVLEHVTTFDAVSEVSALPDNVAATITVHHLFLTLDDVVGGMLKPHHFCKPIAKTPEDRESLLDVAMSGNPKFFLGTDSAPHARGKKECASGCAGVFTAPVAMALLVDLFEQHGTLDRLEGFTSEFGARFYGLPLNEEKVTFTRDPWVVAEVVGDVVPFKAQEVLNWR